MGRDRCVAPWRPDPGNLAGRAGRAVASASEFAYCNGLKALPGRGYRRWTKAALAALPASPRDAAPGTMTVVGMPDPKERAAAIACLARHDARRE
jgi:cytochrome c2